MIKDMTPSRRSWRSRRFRCSRCTWNCIMLVRHLVIDIDIASTCCYYCACAPPITKMQYYTSDQFRCRCNIL